MKDKIKNIGRVAALAGALAGATQVQSEEPIEQETPTNVRTTFSFTPDSKGYEIGLGENGGILGEYLKLKLTDKNDSEDFSFGLRTDLDLGDLENTLWLTGSTAKEGVGIETRTQFDNTALDISFDGTPDALHLGAGLNQIINGDTYGIRFDHVNDTNSGDTNQLLFKFIKDISPETDLGFGYKFVSQDQGEDTHSLTSFISHAGPDVDLGGRAWANLILSGEDYRLIGEGILGQNFRKAYTGWSVGGRANNAALHSQSTIKSPFAEDILAYIQPWNRIESGLVGRVKGTFEEANGEESSSLLANTAYVFNLGEDTKLIPNLSYFTDFEDVSNFGGGFEVQTPIGPGHLRATIGIPDFGDFDEVQARIGFTIPF